MYIIIILLILLTIAILIINITTVIKADIRNQHSNFSLSFSVLNGFIKYTYKIPFIDLSMNGESVFLKIRSVREKKTITNNNQQKKTRLSYKELRDKVRQIKRYLNKYKDTLKYINKKLIIKELIWKSKIGVEDAAVTAVLHGTLNAIKNTIVMWMLQKQKKQNSKIVVNADFNKSVIETSFSCIISLKLVHIIIVTYKIFKAKRQGGESNE